MPPPVVNIPKYNYMSNGFRFFKGADFAFFKGADRAVTPDMEFSFKVYKIQLLLSIGPFNGFLNNFIS
jgi:hypothetical protein